MKSSPRSFRIEEELYESITEIARAERLSVNQVANRALRSYVDWDASPSTRAMVSVPSTLLNKLMDYLTTEQARDLGRTTGSELFISSLRTRFPRLDAEDAIEGFRRLATYGRRFTFDHTVDGTHHSLFIRHSGGGNWSHYYGGAIEGIFADFLGLRVELKVSVSTCLARFDE